MTRARLRDLGILIGKLPTGKYNAITDVPGIRVGHCTVVHDEPRVARTGVTIIFPRTDTTIWDDHCFAAFHVLNGNGDLTGTHWIEESGLLTAPIAITNTHQVGVVRDTIVKYSTEQHGVKDWVMPLVAETYDGHLNDINGFHVQPEHVLQAIADAKSGVVDEGCVGGGTGMICYDFKAGIGTSSRIVPTPCGQFTVGVLVQANHGDREQLRVNGVPVGKVINEKVVESPWYEPLQAGSIIIVVATDAPLIAGQCRRLAQRATIGLARTGAVGHNGSGDIFLAFSTGNHMPNHQKSLFDVKMLPQNQMNSLFDGVAEAVEEAIVNSLTAAETVTGYKDQTVYAIPLDLLKQTMDKYQYL
ncbi:MAG: P1 family peptidase [Anaerolineae bacterium]